jgi:hypothetical protein
VGQVEIAGATCAEGVLGFIVEEHCFTDVKFIRKYTAKDRTGFCVYDEAFTLPSSEIAKHVAVKTPEYVCPFLKLFCVYDGAFSLPSSEVKNHVADKKAPEPVPVYVCHFRSFQPLANILFSKPSKAQIHRPDPPYFTYAKVSTEVSLSLITIKSKSQVYFRDDCVKSLGPNITYGKTDVSGKECEESGGIGFIIMFCYTNVDVMKSFKTEKGVCVHKSANPKSKYAQPLRSNPCLT